MADKKKQAVSSVTWSSQLGTMLAVAGSAVGFGNFLRFPGLAAQYGGGAFMIAYFCAFLLLGVPLCWVEWSIGRRGGVLGGHSCASAFMLITHSPLWKYLGIAGVLAPLGIGMYYMYLEGWTLGYCVSTASGALSLESSEQFKDFFVQFTGAAADGAAYSGGSTLPWFFFIAVVANLYVLYRGVTKGIEWFCKWSMPVLLVTALAVLLRVLTLGTPDAAYPHRNVDQGLGYMWNPSKTVLVVEGRTVEMVPAEATPQERAALVERVRAERPGQVVEERHISLLQGLLNPELWIAAAGQIFFSLSIGFGTVLSYASYVGRRQDIALVSLTANAANEAVEVGVAGMMIVPAAVSLLGVAAAAGASTFGLGFTVLPEVFAAMPGGQVFGTLFFGLLFLAAVASSISILHPSTAFLEEFWGLSRSQSVAIMGSLMILGAFAVSWFTGNDMLALSTRDFWVGTMCLYLISTLYLVLFSGVWGVRNGLRELRRGARIALPPGLGFVIRWVTPAILLVIFGSWLYQNMFGSTSPHIMNLLNGEPGAVLPMAWILCIYVFMAFVAHTSRRFHKKRPLSKKGGRSA